MAQAKTTVTRGSKPTPAKKKSPLAGMTVDAYVATKVKGWQAKTITLLVQLVRDAAPNAAAVIKWGQPVFESNGPFAYIKAATNHVTFGFWRGAEMKNAKGVLEGAGNRMMHIKIAEGAIDAKLLTAMVKEAVKLNLKNGDPTKRG